MSLQGLDLIADRPGARRLPIGTALAEARPKHRGIGAYGEEMRADLVMQFMRDGLALVVLDLHQPLDQLLVVRAQVSERFRQAVDLAANVQEFRRARRLRARLIIAVAQSAERLAIGFERRQGAPQQRARADQRRQRDGAAHDGQRLDIPPDLVDFRRGVAGDDDLPHAPPVQDDGNGGDGILRMDQGGKPGRRLWAIRRGGDEGGGEVAVGDRIADPHMAQARQAVDQLPQHGLRVRRALEIGDGGHDKIPGYPAHRLGFGLDARARVNDHPSDIGRKPQEKQKPEQKVEPDLQRHATSHAR